MSRKSYADMNCSVAQCLEVVGEWWTMLIIRDAFLGIRRFDDLQQRLGISRNILQQRLTRLVDAGILRRVPYSEHPPRSEYRLTDRGKDLWAVLVAMRQWGDQHAPTAAPPVQMVPKDCGSISEAVMTCSVCGKPIGPSDVESVPRPGYQGSDLLLPGAHP